LRVEGGWFLGEERMLNLNSIECWISCVIEYGNFPVLYRFRNSPLN